MTPRSGPGGPTGALLERRPADPAGTSAGSLPPVGDPGPSGTEGAPGHPRPAPGTAAAAARRVGLALIGVQLVAMVVFSTVQYHRFALTTDFAAYSQAWWKVAHGQLDPWSSVFGTAFWRNDAEFLMWPLALLARIDPHPVVLLWVQDLAVAATEVVTLGWIVEVVARSPHRDGPGRVWVVVTGSALAMALDPWVFQTIGFDFHFETVTTLFVVLAGRALWAGRHRRVWLWVVAALASSVLGALYLVGVGLSGVAAGRRTRRTGLVVAAVGLTVFLALGALGAAGLGQRLINSGYGYLLGPHHGHVTALDVAAGMVRHPGAVAHLVAARWPAVFEFLVVVGLVGVVSPWGAGMALVVFVPSMVNADPAFLRLAQSFQSWPALPFVLVGSVMVVLRLWAGGPRARRPAAGVTAVWAVSLAVVAAAALPLAGRWLAVDPAAAARLAQAEARIPAGAEVVASQGVVGRFALRQDVYPFPNQYHPAGGSDTTFPVQRPEVVFVLVPRQGVEETGAAETQAAARFVRARLGARVVVDGAGVEVLAWTPPPGVRAVSLPAPGTVTATATAAGS